MNYNELNKIICNFLNNPESKMYLETMENVKRLSLIILLNYAGISYETFYDNVPINDSISICNDFFKNIDEKYSKEFLELLKDENYYDDSKDPSKIVVFTKLSKSLNNKFNRSGVTPVGKVYIDYDESLNDIFTICHEIVHRFSYRGYESRIKRFLGETSSILAEFYVEDYLKENTLFDYNEIIKYRKKRFHLVYEESLSTYIQICLIELYLKNGELNENILINHLNSLSNLDFYQEVYRKSLEEIKDIILSGEVNFFRRQRYIIGLIGALEMKKENNFDNFKKLIDILGKDDKEMDKDISVLESIIPVFSGRDFSFNESIIIDNVKNSIDGVKVGEKYAK